MLRLFAGWICLLLAATYGVSYVATAFLEHVEQDEHALFYFLMPTAGCLMLLDGSIREGFFRSFIETADDSEPEEELDG